MPAWRSGLRRRLATCLTPGLGVSRRGLTSRAVFTLRRISQVLPPVRSMTAPRRVPRHPRPCSPRMIRNNPISDRFLHTPPQSRRPQQRPLAPRHSSLLLLCPQPLSQLIDALGQPLALLLDDLLRLRRVEPPPRLEDAQQRRSRAIGSPLSHVPLTSRHAGRQIQYHLRRAPHHGKHAGFASPILTPASHPWRKVPVEQLVEGTSVQPQPRHRVHPSKPAVHQRLTLEVCSMPAEPVHPRGTLLLNHRHELAHQARVKRPMHSAEARPGRSSESGPGPQQLAAETLHQEFLVRGPFPALQGVVMEEHTRELIEALVGDVAEPTVDVSNDELAPASRVSLATSSSGHLLTSSPSFVLQKRYPYRTESTLGLLLARLVPNREARRANAGK
ncbi:hypothetical protein ACCO45_001859 [Purpureocillium lilacinum]|uniref:Uncharacterized protein n=1 Tax=Purpureocillium lilacinum TaxID=33203 RepID=A0ACC4E876_PURLI